MLYRLDATCRGASNDSEDARRKTPNASPSDRKKARGRTLLRIGHSTSRRYQARIVLDMRKPRAVSCCVRNCSHSIFVNTFSPGPQDPRFVVVSAWTHAQRALAKSLNMALLPGAAPCKRYFIANTEAFTSGTHWFTIAWEILPAI